MFFYRLCGVERRIVDCVVEGWMVLGCELNIES